MIIRRGDWGDAVHDVQHRLLDLGFHVERGELEGVFGPSTEAAIRAFQQQRGLPSDGIVGPDTWGELVEAGYRLGDRVLYLRSPAFRGDDVRELQRRLNALGFDVGKEDGIFGQGTHDAVAEFQMNVGEQPDGIVGPGSVNALERIRLAANGPSRAVVRETEDIRQLHRSLSGSRIAIDPGHSPTDPGNAGPQGLVEAEATMLLAEDLAAELTARGAIPLLLRRGGEDPTPSERARMANELAADLCVSLHLNAGDPGAEGTTCFYYGTENTYSPAGQHLAEVVQEELTARLGLTDGRTHRLTLAILRETRMPAVQVEPCFLTNPNEELLLDDAASRREMARAIAAGLGRFFSAGVGDAG
ncbi:MAG: N-acetylmuramoyl-L-alanine amidase [Actinomycetota bacterium]